MPWHPAATSHAAARSHPLVAAPEAAPCRHRRRKQHKAPGTFRKPWYNNVGYKNDSHKILDYIHNYAYIYMHIYIYAYIYIHIFIVTN